MRRASTVETTGEHRGRGAVFHEGIGKKKVMTTFIETIGTLLKEGEEKARRTEEELTRHDAAREQRRLQAQKRVGELEGEITRRFQEMVDIYPRDFSFDGGSLSMVYPGSVTCDLVWAKHSPRRHLRIILPPASTFVRVQWLREGKKEDYAREVEAEKFDTAYLGQLITELISSDRWGRGFYPVV
ncbi:MAG: hypothetical protein ACRDIY_00260 [Chloroflexota bacterium]